MQGVKGKGNDEERVPGAGGGQHKLQAQLDELQISQHS
jgi:hypothetical protein